jgi:hypothetical protein
LFVGTNDLEGDAAHVGSGLKLDTPLRIKLSHTIRHERTVQSQGNPSGRILIEEDPVRISRVQLPDLLNGSHDYLS